jgi:hypothetical protein
MSFLITNYASARDGAVPAESRSSQSEGRGSQAPWAVSGKAAGINLADGTGAVPIRSQLKDGVTFAEMGFNTKPTLKFYAGVGGMDPRRTSVRRLDLYSFRKSGRARSQKLARRFESGTPASALTCPKGL